MPIPLAAIAAIPSLFQAGYGVSQMIRGNRGLRNLERPVYEIPDAVKSQLALASAAFGNPRMPGEAEAYSRAGQAMSQTLRAARDNSNPMALVAASQAATNRSYNDIAVQSAAHQEQDRQGLMSMLGNYAQYQDQKFQINQMAPYADKYNEFREMHGAGAQNLFGGLNSLGSVALNAMAGGAGARSPLSASQVGGALDAAKMSSILDAATRSSSAALQAGGNAGANVFGAPGRLSQNYGYNPLPSSTWGVLANINRPR